MYFLQPAVLWGLLLVALPVIIHLFNFQRPRRVRFTNVALLAEADQTARAYSRLKHWFLMLLRMLFIAAIVLAFALPMWPGEQAGKALQGGKIGIWLDNSYSMQNLQGNRSLLTQGRAVAEELAQAFPKSADFRLTTNDFRGAGLSFSSAKEFQEQLGLVETGGPLRSLSEVQARQASALKNQAAGAGNHLFWISDFQRQNAEVLEKVQLDSSQNYYFIHTPPDKTANLFVDSLWLPEPFLKAGESAEIKVRIRNLSEEAVRDVPLRLYVDGTQVGSSAVSLSAREEATLSLSFTPQKSGWLPGRVELEDFPVDFDNSAFFALRVAKKLSILNAYAGDSGEKIARALAAEPFFAVETQTLNNLDYNKLQEVDALILSGVNEADAALQAAVSRFLERGGLLLLFPGDAPKAGALSALTGLPLSAQTPPETPQAVQAPNAQTPFFEGVFERIPPNMDVPKVRPVLQLQGGQPLMRLRSGSPFYVQQRQGGSRVFVSAVPLAENFGNFSQHALFVPVLYKTLFSGGSNPQRLAFFLGETDGYRIQGDSLRAGVQYRLRRLGEGAGAAEIVPTQQLRGKTLFMQMPSSELSPGHYALTDEAGRSQGLLALNAPRRESDLSFYSLERLKTQFERYPNVQFFEAKDPKAFGADFRAANLAQPLWKYFVVLALLCLLAETLAVRFMGKA